MFQSLQTISRKGKIKLAAWTIFGTLGCIAVSVTYNITAFWDLGRAAFIQSIISATVLPIIIAGPMFFYLTVKLRETAILNHKLKDFASIDGLTGCLNRAAFTHRVHTWFQRANSNGATSPSAFLLIDVDHFKKVNDTHGHITGDEALQLVAGIIRSTVRKTDLVGRMGGEEFAIFLPDTDREAAPKKAEEIRLAIQRTELQPTYGSSRLRLTVSIGCVTCQSANLFEDVYRTADSLLYKAKTGGRNQVVTSDGEKLKVANDDRLTA
ncbi:MAG: hypothetical protein RLZZ444_2468 [Pseudomonadota bacterium]